MAQPTGGLSMMTVVGVAGTREAISVVFLQTVFGSVYHTLG